MKWIVLLIAFFNNFARADEFSFSYGLGMGESAVNSISETKALEFSYRDSLTGPLYWNFETGGWLDTSGGTGRSSSIFLSTGPGYIVDLGGFEIRNAYGIAYITDPDIYLGGNCPQFHGELYAGFRDKQGNGIGVKYNHFSSAGIYQPNVGRDFILLELSTRW